MSILIFYRLKDALPLRHVSPLFIVLLAVYVFLYSTVFYFCLRVKPLKRFVEEDHIPIASTARHIAVLRFIPPLNSLTGMPRLPSRPSSFKALLSPRQAHAYPLQAVYYPAQ
jgi:hypothetical protein